MTIIDENTVVVYSSSELKSVLEGNNSYNYVYFGSNITLTSGISISSSKSVVVIDGTHDNVRYTYQDMKSTSIDGTISVRSAAISKVTVKNIDVIGYNYYGIICVPENETLKDVVIEYNNLVYSGPQITYHPTGLSRYIDCDIKIVTSNVSPQEVAECNRIEIGGKTTIRHESSSDSSFWFRGATVPYFKILEDADVNMTSINRELFYGVTNLVFSVLTGAKFLLTTALGVGYGTYSTGNVLIDKDAYLEVVQTKRNGSYPTWYCNGSFVMNEGSSLVMINNYSGITSANYNIYFRTTSSSLTLYNPKKVVLYNSNANVFYSDYSIKFDITYSRANLWTVADAIDIAGSIADLPTYSWYKEKELSNLVGSFTGISTVISSNNYTEEELNQLPALTNFKFQNKVFSLGTLLLNLHPVSDEALLIRGYSEPYAFVKITYLDESLTVEANDLGYFELKLNEPLAIGTEIGYIANVKNSFLYRSRMIVIVYAGELVFDKVPTIIRFKIVPFSTNPVLCSRENTVEISITDSRIDSTDWKLYASVEGNLISTNGHVLTDSIVFIGDDGNIITLGSNPILIYSGTNNEGDVETTDITWDFDKGILLRVSNEAIQIGDEYTTEIIWTLEE